MDIADAQREMRWAHFAGGLGALVSGLVWLAAAAVALTRAPMTAAATLLIGGMAIYPLSVLLCKAVGRPGSVGRANPLAGMALEVTLLFVMCLPFAYLAAQSRPDWFFPGMLMLIGGRYLSFRTLYGLPLYLVFGALLAAAGFALLALHAPFGAGPLTGALIELTFAALLIAAGRRDPAAAALAGGAAASA
jgi:hypothetical protein